MDGARRQTLTDAQRDLEQAEGLLKEGLKVLQTARTRVAEAGAEVPGCKAARSPRSQGLVPEHRKEHRPGRVAKLDADPTLRAFVLSRLERLTFEQIARDVEQHFPAGKRVGKSAIQAWYRKRMG